MIRSWTPGYTGFAWGHDFAGGFTVREPSRMVEFHLLNPEAFALALGVAAAPPALGKDAAFAREFLPFLPFSFFSFFLLR